METVWIAGLLLLIPLTMALAALCEHRRGGQS